MHKLEMVDVEARVYIIPVFIHTTSTFYSKIYILATKPSERFG